MIPGSEGWWNHTLALALHMTVEDMLERMSATEYQGWKDFFEIQPFDDRARYHVPAAAVSASNGADFRKVLALFRREPEDDAGQWAGYSPQAVEMFKALGHVPPRRKKE